MKLPRVLRVFDADHLIPAEIRSGDTETLRKARIAVYFSMALLAQCAIYIPTYAFWGFPELSGYLVVGGALLCLVPLTLRLRRPLPWVGLHIGGLALAVLTATAIHSGGLHSTSLWWMCMVPIVAMLVSGRRLALLMAGFQTAIVVAFDRAFAAGVVWPAGPSPLTQPDVILWDVVLLMATLVALAWLFEKAKEKMRTALAANNRELQLVLDSVGQGFLSCDVAGTVVGRHSAIAERWFGAGAKGQEIWAYLGGADERLADQFRFSWSAIADDVLPIELCLDQLPKRIARDSQVFQLEYQPVISGEALSLIVIVITDVTAVVESERKEAAQRELAAALDCALHDPAGFLQFMEEVESLVSQLEASNPALKRALHTLKGNCAFFGAHSVAAASHALEDRIAEGPIARADLDALKALWRSFSEPLSLIVDRRAGVVEIGHEDLGALRDAVRNGADPSVLDRMVTELRYEPVERALRRSAVQACALAHRLEKGEIGVVVEACDVRLDPQRWKPLWSAFDHAIRNAVDHGLERPDERLARGKPLAGQLRLSADLVGDELVITLADDGRGVDWERIRERARSRGLAHETAADLENASSATV